MAKTGSKKIILEEQVKKSHINSLSSREIIKESSLLCKEPPKKDKKD
jgi:hypothetical protein